MRAFRRNQFDQNSISGIDDEIFDKYTMTIAPGNEPGHFNLSENPDVEQAML